MESEQLFLISYSQTEEKEQGGQDEVHKLEGGASPEPPGIAYVGKSKADEERGVRGVENVGKAVSEGEGKHAELGRESENLCDGEQNGHEHKGLGRT